MTASGWLQLALILLGVIAITKPLGIYLVRVLDPEHEGSTFLDRFLGPIERLIYRLIGVDPKREQNLVALRDLDDLVHGDSDALQLRAAAAAAAFAVESPRAQLRCGRTWRSIPLSASRPTPIGKATAVRAR